MGFSKRFGFVPGDESLLPEDYQQMRLINRAILTKFFTDSIGGFERAAINFSKDELNSFSVQDNWEDENLDDEIKPFLKVGSHGRFISPDLAAHFEYFYNTLSCTFEPENPFTCPGKYPALLYQTHEKCLSPDGFTKMTVLDKHKNIIFPQNSNSDKNTSANSQPVDYLSPYLPKKYRWYPNMAIKSPVFS